jgi:hypothetical protein
MYVFHISIPVDLSNTSSSPKCDTDVEGYIELPDICLSKDRNAKSLRNLFKAKMSRVLQQAEVRS